MPLLDRLLPALSALGAQGSTANARAELQAARSATAEVDALVARIAHRQAPGSTRRAA